MEVVWSELAFESVTDIIAYVESFFSKATAQRVAREIFSFVGALAEHPYIGLKFAEMADGSEIRCAFYKVNHIYYQVCKESIEVVIVWDGRQNPDTLWRLLDEYIDKRN